MDLYRELRDYFNIEYSNFKGEMDEKLDRDIFSMIDCFDFKDGDSLISRFKVEKRFFIYKKEISKKEYPFLEICIKFKNKYGNALFLLNKKGLDFDNFILKEDFTVDKIDKNKIDLDANIFPICFEFSYVPLEGKLYEHFIEERESVMEHTYDFKILNKEIKKYITNVNLKDKTVTFKDTEETKELFNLFKESERLFKHSGYFKVIKDVFCFEKIENFYKEKMYQSGIYMNDNWYSFIKTSDYPTSDDIKKIISDYLLEPIHSLYLDI